MTKNTHTSEARMQQETSSTERICMCMSYNATLIYLSILRFHYSFFVDAHVKQIYRQNASFFYIVFPRGEEGEPSVWYTQQTKY